jgi:hypothetical protein
MSGGYVVVVDDELEVVECECPFTDGCSAFHSHAALEGATNDGRVSCLFDCGEMSLELLRDAR